MDTKTCTKCKEDKELNFFSKTRVNESTGKQYYNSWCNQCRTQQHRDKRGQSEPKKFAEKTDTHRECMNCHNMFLYKDCFGSYCKRCYKIRFTNKKSARKATQRYRKRHHARWKATHRIHQFNRRHKMEITNDGTITDEFLSSLFEKEICCWCDNYTQLDDRTFG